MGCSEAARSYFVAKLRGSHCHPIEVVRASWIGSKVEVLGLIDIID